MLDLITIGNIAADLYFTADELTTRDKRFYLALGGKYFAEKFYFSVGGGAANVAVGAKKNGLKSAVCAIIGNNPFRKYILHSLKLKKVPTHLAVFKQNYTNVSTILLKKNGARTIINHETPHEHIADDKLLLKNLRQTRSVYLGNLPDVTLEERKKILHKLKDRGVFIFANIGKQDCCRPKKHLNKFLKYVDVLILNSHEFSDMARKEYNRLNFKKDVSALLPIMKGKILIVTDAEKGSYGYQDGNVFYQRAISPEKIIDTTGAGDGYSAGFIAGYLKEEDIQVAMKRGSQYAARILGKLGAN